MTISKNFHVVSLLRYLDRLLFGLEIIEVSIKIFSCYLDMRYLEKENNKNEKFFMNQNRGS